MQIYIDTEGCTGCGLCVDVCPCDVFRLSESSRAEARYEGDCWFCGACERDCPVQAIRVDLPYLLT